MVKCMMQQLSLKITFDINTYFSKLKCNFCFGFNSEEMKDMENLFGKGNHLQMNIIISNYFRILKSNLIYLQKHLQNELLKIV